MKNAIRYYYNLFPNDVHQNNRTYFFNLETNKYILYELDRDEKELNELYVLNNILIQKGYPYSSIILNKFNSIVTDINNTKYVLLKVNVEKYEVSTAELYQTNIMINNEKFKYINRQNWYELWSKKIDSIEFLVKKNEKKYKKIKNSIDYYIGLAETAISMAKKINVSFVCIAHRKIDSSKNSFSIYNPLNLILDYPIRDLCENYKKTVIENKKVDIREEKMLIEYITNISTDLSFAFLSRLIFPNYYFNAVEKIINNEEKEEEITKIIKKSYLFEEKIELFYDIIKIKNKNIDIEWIKKT